MTIDKFSHRIANLSGITTSTVFHLILLIDDSDSDPIFPLKSMVL